MTAVRQHRAQCDQPARELDHRQSQRVEREAVHKVSRGLHRRLPGQLARVQKGNRHAALGDLHDGQPPVDSE